MSTHNMCFYGENYPRFVFKNSSDTKFSLKLIIHKIGLIKQCRPKLHAAECLFRDYTACHLTISFRHITRQ